MFNLLKQKKLGKNVDIRDVKVNETGSDDEDKDYEDFMQLNAFG